MPRKQKICVIRTDRLGDMVLTLPMCKALKENCVESEITLIARRYVEPLLENCTVIDRIFYIDDYKNGIKEIFKNNKFDVYYLTIKFMTTGKLQNFMKQNITQGL